MRVIPQMFIFNTRWGGLSKSKLKKIHSSPPTFKALRLFHQTIRPIHPLVASEAIVHARAFYGGEGFHDGVDEFGGEAMDEGAEVGTGTLEGTENVRGDFGFGGNVEPRVGDGLVEMRGILAGTEIGVQEMPARSEDAGHGPEEVVLPGITMGRFHIQNGIEMFVGEIKGLGIPGLEVDAEAAMHVAAKFDGFGILVEGGVGSGLVISFDEGCTSAMTATDFENVFPLKRIATGNVMVELDGGAVGFVGGVEGEGFAFRGPVAVVEEGDGLVFDAPGEGLIPVFPEGLLEGGHGATLGLGYGNDTLNGQKRSDFDGITRSI